MTGSHDRRRPGDVFDGLDTFQIAEVGDVKLLGHLGQGLVQELQAGESDGIQGEEQRGVPGGEPVLGLVPQLGEHLTLQERADQIDELAPAGRDVEVGTFRHQPLEPGDHPDVHAAQLFQGNVRRFR